MERDFLKISRCILPTGINPISILSLSRPECWKNYSLFNFKPSGNRHFFPLHFICNFKTSKSQSQLKVNISELMLLYQQYVILMSEFAMTTIALNQHSCPQIKTTVFMVINHIFCDISFRIDYMFTREQPPSSHWATKAILPVTKK